jgi:hypothetical protein
MALPQIILARQAVALLAVAKDVYAGVSRLPPEERAKIAADTARLQELMLRLSGRALTKFGGTQRLGSKVGRIVPVGETKQLTHAEYDELRLLISRLSGFAALHVSASADRQIGRGMRGAVTTRVIRTGGRQAGTYLVRRGSRPVQAEGLADEQPALLPPASEIDLRSQLQAWLAETDSVDGAGAPPAIDAALEAAAFLLVRHGLLRCAEDRALTELVTRMQQVDTPALAGVLLDELHAELRKSLHVAAVRGGASDSDAWQQADSVIQAAFDAWCARQVAILQGASGPSTDVSVVREQVETLLAFRHQVEIEPGGDLSFAHGSTCMFVSVEEWQGHPVVQLSLPVLFGAEPTHALLMRVVTEGTYLFGHLMVDERDGLIDLILTHGLLGDHLDPPELLLAVELMTEVADGIDDQLAAQFGGTVYDAAFSSEALIAPDDHD